MSNLSLIPEQQKKRTLSSVASFGKKKFALSTGGKVGAALLVVALVVTGALMFWSRSIENERQIMQEEFRMLQSERDGEAERRIVRTQARLTSFEQILNSHRNWSRFLELVEERAISQVTLTLFEGMFSTSEVSLTGRTPNYNVLARQVRSFEASEFVRDVQVSNVRLDEGVVTFLMTIRFDRSFLEGVTL